MTPLEVTEGKDINFDSKEQFDAHVIATLSPEDRDELLALTPDEIDQGYPGFLSGERLKHCFNEQAFLPKPELMDSMLYAGQGSFDGLQRYTYEHISNLTVQLKIDHNTESVIPLPKENITKAIGMVERFMNGDYRRTGEPGIAHIYRTILRTGEVIEYYNSLYNSSASHIRFTPQIAEIMYLTAILHDFVEDQIPQDEFSFERGEVKTIYPPNGHDANFYLRRAVYKNRGRKYIGNSESDIKLDLEPTFVPYLENALKALNTSKVEQNLIMDHLLEHVEKQNGTTEHFQKIPLYDIDQYILRMIPLYIKTGADRPDNDDTYFLHKNQHGNMVTTPVDRLKKKAKENISIFNRAELQMLTDGPAFLVSDEINNILVEESESESLLMSPSSLCMFPSRWAKLLLLGLSPNQMYTIPKNGGLPKLK